MNEIEEFIAIVESIAMPEYMQSALMEAFYETHDVDRTPLSDEDIAMLLDRMEAGNKATGIPFNRKQTEVDMKTHPWKYRKYVGHKPIPKSKLMMNNDITLPIAPVARNRIYWAVLSMLKNAYQKCGIPFDSYGYMAYIKETDKNFNHRPFDRSIAAGNLQFSTFDEANRNPVVRQLSGENPAFYDVMKQAFVFFRGLSQCHSEAERDVYLFRQRERMKNTKAPVIERPKAELTGQDAEEFANKELAEQSKLRATMATSKRYDSILDFAKEFPGLSYLDLYRQFVTTAGPSAQKDLPKPGESMSSAVSHIDKGDKVMMPFLRNLHQMIDLAYPHTSVDEEIKKNLSTNSRFSSAYNAAKEDAEKAMIHPADKPLYALWRTCHAIGGVR